MLTFRIISRLDIRPPRLIKTIRLEGVRVVGDPAEYARRYDSEGIDEILYLDVVASLYGRNSLADLLDQTTADVFTPVTAGGGIRSVVDGWSLLRGGADKLALNTAAIQRPELITELAEKFGSQAIVIQIDAKRKADGWEAHCDGGRQPTGKNVVAWARESVERGAGELLVTAIDREGTRAGIDTDLGRAVVQAVTVPVVLSGGFDGPQDAVAAARVGASGIAIARVLHYNRVKLSAIREALYQAGIPVRTPRQEAVCARSMLTT